MENQVVPTGNVRFSSYGLKPIPRMTNTFLQPNPLKKKTIIESGLHLLTPISAKVSQSGNVKLLIGSALIINKFKPIGILNSILIEGCANKLASSIEVIGSESCLYAPIDGCAKKRQNYLSISFGGPRIICKELTVKRGEYGK